MLQWRRFKHVLHKLNRSHWLWLLCSKGHFPWTSSCNHGDCCFEHFSVCCICNAMKHDCLANGQKQSFAYLRQLCRKHPNNLVPHGDQQDSTNNTLHVRNSMYQNSMQQQMRHNDDCMLGTQLYMVQCNDDIIPDSKDDYEVSKTAASPEVKTLQKLQGCLMHLTSM